MEKVTKPLYSIIYNSKDISLDVASYAVSVSYSDYLDAKSDSIELVFEDRDDRWKNSWYPQKGDEIELKLGILEKNEEKWLNAGSFQIDEIEFNSPPDTINIKGLSSYIKQPFRELKTRSFENMTLSSIVSQIAKGDGLDTHLEIDPDIPFKRLDQKSKSDLEFLKELAKKWGYYTKIDHNRLIFVKLEKMEKAGAVETIEKGKSGIVSFSFSDKTHKIYKACTVSWWDAKTKKKLSYTYEDEGIVKGDILKVNERVENMAQAIEMAKQRLKNANRLQTTGSLSLFGNPYLVSGAKVLLSGFGMLDGEYLIEEAHHRITKSEGYTTEVRIRRC